VVAGRLNEFKTVMPLFYTSSSLIEFVFGMIVFHLYIQRPNLTVNRKILTFLGAAGFALLYGGSRINDKFVLGVAASIIVWVFIHAFRGTNIRTLRVIGDASYSIYLFHAAVFVAVRGAIKSAELSPNSYINTFVIILGQVLIAVVAGIMVYYLIERPMLNTLRRRI
jgi:peptidoglycan/LPS O-acetylase OafA/YrhL